MSTRLVPLTWMPPAAMSRVIIHWTGGDYHANGLDREHYHLLIEGDGKLVRGDEPITANVSTRDRDGYAAHTRGCNTGSIGVTVCCMRGALESPRRFGSYPMTREQWEAMAVAVADLCDRYEIPVGPRTVLGHGEVERILKIDQNGKWDPLSLPWAPDVPSAKVGDVFRSAVSAALKKPQAAAGEAAPCVVRLDGRVITDDAVILDGASWLPIRPLCVAQGWRINDFHGPRVWVSTPGGVRTLTFQLRGDRGYCPVRGVCEAMGWPAPVWLKETRTVEIRSAW
ncbi:MAG: N-acetylmuramoyl-L-alanine amidase [Armatimonadota bacterium]